MQQEAFAAALVPNIKRQITQVENALNVLMARMPQSITRGQLLFAQTLTPAIPVGLPSQLLERRPDIVAAEQSLKAQFQRIGIAKAAMFPTPASMRSPIRHHYIFAQNEQFHFLLNPR